MNGVDIGDQLRADLALNRRICRGGIQALNYDFALGVPPKVSPVPESEKMFADLPPGHMIEKMAWLNAKPCVACGVKVQRLIYGFQ